MPLAIADSHTDHTFGGITEEGCHVHLVEYLGAGGGRSVDE
jgi:hypothetical protein